MRSTIRKEGVTVNSTHSFCWGTQAPAVTRTCCLHSVWFTSITKLVFHKKTNRKHFYLFNFCQVLCLQKSALVFPPTIATKQNHRVIWVGRHLKDPPVPTPFAMARDIFHLIRLLRAHPTWSWTHPGMGHPWLLWATSFCASSPWG